MRIPAEAAGATFVARQPVAIPVTRTLKKALTLRFSLAQQGG